MKRLDSAKYLVDPGEKITFDITLPAHAGIAITHNGISVPASVAFTIIASNTPGAVEQISILLNGNPGDVAIVKIAIVDGSTDVTAIIASTTDPKPVGHYTFIVSSAPVSNISLT